MISKIFFVYLIAIYVCLVVPLQDTLTVTDVANCPAGYYCVVDIRTGIINPQPCPPGTYSEIGASSCTPCSVGEWTVRHGSSYCDLCPIAHMCPNPSLAPLPCPLGTANPWPRQPSCFACSIGDYTPALQRPTCTACSYGHYCSDPAEQPKLCPPGKSDFDNNLFSELFLLQQEHIVVLVK